jgi:miniconductance mechanosensitive channel
MFEFIRKGASKLFQPLQFNEETLLILSEGISFFSLVVLAIIAYYLSWYIIKRTLIVIITRSENKYDDILLKNKTISRFSYLVPSYIINTFAPATLPSFPQAYEFVQNTIEVYVVFVVALVLDSLLSTAHDIYKTFEVAKSKPIKGLVQVLKIVLYIAAGLMIIATLAGQSIGSMLIGLGTISAVLMLVFKDPILGFVGGMQLSMNDMVRIGDWISMPKYGADGDVLEITLTTVKVQNWDRTITTIPTYAMVTDYFQNWRGMEESGGRRIKRHISLDMESVRFCTPEMLEKYKSYQLISQYLEDKEKDIQAYNNANGIDTSNLVNGRRQTNLGVFRAYIKAYLTNHPRVHLGMTMLVRQLQPTEKGIPIEIYVFSNRQAWAEYEDLQSDIFDHVLSVIPMFDLRIFQAPNNYSLSKLAEVLQEKEGLLKSKEA